MRVQQALRAATATLSAAGVASARADATWLVCHAYGLTPTQLHTVGELEDSEATRLDGLIRQRAQGIPLQHLTGRAPFRHLDLEVGPGVFIPRPETELIIELAAGALADANLVVDLCAGSGAIALGVAQEYLQTRVIAVERADAALAFLSRNAARQAAGGDRPVEVVQADIRDPALLAGQAGTVDVLLSNPPYVPGRSRDRLAREISHDPEDAVFGGEDGLALVPDLIDTAARLLRPGGYLVLEHDDSHGDAVPALLVSTGQWHTVADHDDLAGRPRFASALRN